MANTLYPLAKPKLRTRTVNLTTDTIKVQLVDTGAYTYSAAHEFLSDIPAGARIGAPQTLANKADYFGMFDADDTTFTSVPAGTGTASAAEALAIYKDTGAAATSSLIALFDTATGLPVTPDGGNIRITWDAAGLLSLA